MKHVAKSLVLAILIIAALATGCATTAADKKEDSLTKREITVTLDVAKQQELQKLTLDVSEAKAAITRFKAIVTELRKGSEAAKAEGNLLEDDLRKFVGLEVGPAADLARVKAFLTELKAKAEAGEKTAQTMLDSLKGLVELVDDAGEEPKAADSDSETAIVKYTSKSVFVWSVRPSDKWANNDRVVSFNGVALYRLPELGKGKCLQIKAIRGAAYREVRCP